jgi:hypothetical protein
MKKYMLLFCGRDESPDARERWGTWFGENGSRLIDGGGPLGPGRQVTADGASDAEGAPFIGYSIISAASLEEAERIAATAPSSAGVRVYEALPM